MDPFTHHLVAAIGINLRRARTYALRTGGRSLFLSATLVALECAALPAAHWVARRADTQARRDLLEAAFVAMDDLPHAHTSPRFISRSAAQVREAGFALGELAGRRGRPGDVLTACRATLSVLDALEEAHSAHLAMSRHMVESVARAAALTVAMGMEADPFALGLIQLQLRALVLCQPLDALAQACHTRGAGILTNDLPAISEVDPH
jgi:hypothetical protein